MEKKVLELLLVTVPSNTGAGGSSKHTRREKVLPVTCPKTMQLFPAGYCGP